jgi:hypothetical protein
MVYFGERPPEGPSVAAGGGGTGEGGGGGGGAQAHLALGTFNALDLCNCLTGISLMRAHCGLAGAAQGQQVVGEELFDQCLQQACKYKFSKKSAPQWLYSVKILGVRRSLLRHSAREAVVSTLSSIQMSQVLEACRHVDCVGDKRLTIIFEAIRRRLEAVPELVEAARSGYVPAAVPDQIDPGDSKGVRPAHGAVAEAAVKAFDNDRRSLISTWVIASTAASTPGASESASVLSQLLIPVVSDLGLLSFARRADMLLMLEALELSCSWAHVQHIPAHVQHNPSATIAARLIQRALQFDQFGDAEPGGGDTETGATGAPPSAGLVRFTFRVSLFCM